MAKDKHGVKIAAVVVTYNRKEMLRNCIQKLKDQSYKVDCIYVIDNASSDGTFQEFAKRTDMVYYRMPENEGGSGGFYYGIKQACEDGYDYIWGMDDDAFPARDSLEKIMDKVFNMPGNTCFWSNCDKDALFENGLKEVNEWMFVGFFLPREVIRTVGLPRRDFFIYFDDYEYADRIIKNGFHIYKVKDSIIKHKSTPENSIAKIKIGNKIINVTDVPKQNWKSYYWVRNDILRYSNFDRRKALSIFIRCPRKLLKTILFRPSNTLAVIKGYIHGIAGKSGKYMAP